MLTYARVRVCKLLIFALARLLAPEALAQPLATTDAPPPKAEQPEQPAPPPVEFRVPAMVRVARSVATARAMVQAANALAAGGEDQPSGLQVHTTYPDGLMVFMRMDTMQMDGSEVPDDDQR